MENKVQNAQKKFGGLNFSYNDSAYTYYITDGESVQTLSIIEVEKRFIITTSTISE